MLKTNYRDFTCNDLGIEHVNKEVTLSGWVHSRRDHGGIIFIDLRDRYGITQIVFDPEFNKEAHEEAEKLRREDVIKVKGIVKRRKEGMENPKIATGKIEVFVNNLEILSKAETPPIEVDEYAKLTEEQRLKYRYLDLRRKVMKERIEFRHKVARLVREYLNNNSFLEIETPMLIRHTPEGARDFVVPSRIHPGKFYSLPQSPQLYKQLLMVAGMDRYYQLARCLRDEDLRADRQPEFTQIDIEMSFVNEEDVMNLCDGLIKYIFKKALNIDIKTPIRRMKYDEAIEKYGTDRPDLRFGLELIDITEIAKKTEFNIFKQGEVTKCLALDKEISRKEIDELIEFIKQKGSEGLAWVKVKEDSISGGISKFFNEETTKALLNAAGINEGVIFFISGKRKKVNELLGELRLEIARRYGLINENKYEFVWITDFPMFEYNEETQRWEAMHHPFTMPKEECWKYFNSKEYDKIYAKAYDIVLNGTEIGGGSIRIHIPEIQKKVFEAIGLSEEKAREKFGFLLEAFKYGVPPHGGIAFGFDRLVALMLGINDIREVIAFPKTKSMESPMDGSPTELEEERLKELHIKLDIVKSKGNEKK